MPHNLINTPARTHYPRTLSLSAQARYLRCVMSIKAAGAAPTHRPTKSMTRPRISGPTSLGYGMRDKTEQLHWFQVKRPAAAAGRGQVTISVRAGHLYTPRE